MGLPKPSASGKLSTEDWAKWQKNIIAFLVPLVVIYIGALLPVLREPFHHFSLNDLIPTDITAGAIALYVANAIYDLARKYLAGN